MSALVQTVRVDRAFRVLRECVESSLGSELPADSYIIGIGSGAISVPRRPRPFVFFQPLTLPAMVRAFKDEKHARECYAKATYQVVSAASGYTYKARVNGLPAAHVAQVGESVTDIRDALVLAVNDLADKVTATAVGGDSLDVTPDAFGSLYAASTPTSAARLAVSYTLHAPARFAQYSIGRRRMTARLQFFSAPGKSGSEGAHYLATLAYDGLDERENTLRLLDNRIAVRPISDPTNLSGVDPGGAVNEQRASFDVSIDVSSLHAREIVPVSTVEFVLDANGDLVTFTQP